MPIDPRELRPQPTLVDLIDTDRPCGRCGYSLKGLPSNGRCPECGYPISRRARRGTRRFTDNLADAPLFYLKTLALGAVLLAVCSVVAGLGFSALSRRGGPIAATIAGAASIGWWMGVFICTSPRPVGDGVIRDVFLESNALRWTNRIVQAAWAASAVAYFGSFRAPGPTDEILKWSEVALQIIAILGLVPLSIQLSSLGDWAGDTGLSDRFRIGASIMTISGVIAGASTIARMADLQGFWWALRIAGIWAAMAMAVAEVLFLFSLCQLAHICLWAIRNSLTAHEVARRLIDRQDDPLAHRACTQCGYDMGGLAAFDRCPECGHMDESVRQSGLFALRHGREAAEHAGDGPPIPLEPAAGRPPLRISTPEPIKHRRRPHPPPQP